MTWYAWAFLSMIAGSLESIIDKVIIVKKPERIDILVAMFYRNLGFFIFIWLIGLSGFMGKLTFVFAYPLLILAIVYPLASFSYDYFLRNNELSRFGALFYTLPIFFIVFDTFVTHTQFTVLQVIGVVSLVLGATLFSYDVKNKRSSFSWKGWFWMAIYLAVNAYLYIAFKLTSTTVNGVSFYFSVWALIMGVYIVLLIFSGRYKKLKESAVTDGFLWKNFIAKGFDALSGVFLLQAVSLAYLTLVSAFTSLSPLILLAMLILMSLITRIKAKEDFSRNTLALKIVATLLLVMGGFFIF